MLTFKRKRSPAVTDKARGQEDSRARLGQDPATANVRFLSHAAKARCSAACCTMPIARPANFLQSGGCETA